MDSVTSLWETDLEAKDRVSEYSHTPWNLCLSKLMGVDHQWPKLTKMEKMIWRLEDKKLDISSITEAESFSRSTRSKSIYLYHAIMCLRLINKTTHQNQFCELYSPLILLASSIHALQQNQRLFLVMFLRSQAYKSYPSFSQNSRQWDRLWWRDLLWF